MNKNQRNRQRGIALVSVLLVLVMLIVMGIALMYVADTDTAINANYRSEQQAYFAAKAGIEEVRGRMRRTATNTLDGSTAANQWLPTAVPSDAGGVLYVLNPLPSETVQPWDSSAGNKYVDDELCHDGYVMSGLPAPGSAPADDVRCTLGGYMPSSGAWYNTPRAGAPAPGYATSTAPLNGTAAALPYKWVRITWKQNNSMQNYTTDGTPASSPTGTTPLCWDGKKEVLLQSPATKCEDMPSGMRPVYLATSLALAGGSRRMVQTELAKTTLALVPAALALDGPEPVFSPITSNNGTMIGWDSASTPCPPAGNWPAVGTYTSYDATQVAVALNAPNVKQPNWSGGPSNSTNFNAINIGPAPFGPWVSSTTGTGTASCSPTPSSAFCPGMAGNLNQLATVSGLQDLVNTVIQSADTIVPIGSAPSLPMGTDANPQITVIGGDFNYSGNNFIGAGILLVQGKVNISGSPTFDGTIYIIGEGYLNTSGTANYGGSVLIANINHLPNPPSSNAQTALGISAYPAGTPGNPTFIGGGGGGNGGVNYNSCKANLGNDRIPYKVLATREIQY